MLELVVDAATRVPLVGDITIGRAPGSTVRLEHPTVSRMHARISANGGPRPMLEDAGSSHGTFLDGERVSGPQALRDGARIRVGNLELRVERAAGEAEPPEPAPAPGGGTIVVPAATAPVGEAVHNATQFGLRPRLRGGVRIKHLPEDEGDRRWVVNDPATDAFVHLGEDDGALLALLDGTLGLSDLVAEAERRMGPEGAPRLARLLADMGDRGLLEGVVGGRPQTEAREGWRRLLTPRELTSERLARVFAPLYRAGGRLLFTRPALVLLALVAVAGLVASVVLVVERYGTPFVVASKLGIGGLVFLAGRTLLVGFHEAAHGLTLAHYGRPVRRAGIKLVVVFPYAFVDTSESWFEPRRRRIAVSAAGPVSDLVLAGAFALSCLLLPAGTVRDICFNVAFAGYVGALFNLNPFLDRDGYHILVDVLRQPGLRTRARAQLQRSIAGRALLDDEPVLTSYAQWGAVWSVLAGGLAIVVTLQFAPIMTELAPPAVVWIVLGTLWAALFVPVVIIVAKPLLYRFRGG